jgi:hypothetical protein
MVTCCFRYHRRRHNHQGSPHGTNDQVMVPRYGTSDHKNDTDHIDVSATHSNDNRPSNIHLENMKR